MKTTSFKKVSSFSLTTAITLFAFFSAPHFSYAQEQTTEQATPEQVIEIKAERERFIDYQQMYEYAKKTQTITHGHVAFAFQLMPQKPDVQMDNIRIWLESKSKSIPLKSYEKNTFIVHVDDEIAAEKGQYAINKKAGELKWAGNWVPIVPKTDWTIGLAKQVIDETNVAIKKILTWYAIPFAPKVKSVGVCTKEAGIEVQIKDGDNIISAVTTKNPDKNYGNQSVFCVDFDKTTEFKDNLRIVIPDSAEVMLN